MKRDDVFQLGAYVVAASLAVGGAFIVSSRFLASVRAQEGGALQGSGGTTTGDLQGSGAAQPAPADATLPPPPAADAPPADAGQATGAPAGNGQTDGGQNLGAQPSGQPAMDPNSGNMGDSNTAPVFNGGNYGGNSGIAELEGFLEPFIYDIVNRRDPFQAYAEYVPVDMEGPPRALSPAQRWELEQLKLVGIMWDVKDPKAMFLDPEEEVMILGRDESIGNRNGYIAAIREGEVIVVEAIRKRGDIIYRTRVLRIER